MAGILRTWAFLPLAPRRPAAEDAAMRIEIPLFEGFDDVDAIGPFEVLANAAFTLPGVTVELVGAHGAGEVVSSHGARVVTDRGLSADADLVIVPGGGWNGPRHYGLDVSDEVDERVKGLRRQFEDGRLASKLAELHAGGATLASVCTGALLLAGAGVLDGRPATTHRGNLDQLAGLGADVDRTARVVDDGDVLTCGGVTSGLDLALHIVEREWGSELATGIASLMEHERVGPVRVSRAARAAGPAPTPSHAT
jgi:transcriptional regulator GlxA family with amidase domain